MTSLRPIWLLIISGSAALLGFVATVLMVSNGYGSPVLPPSSLITLIAVGLLVLTLGILVWWDKRRLDQAADRAAQRAREARRDQKGGAGTEDDDGSRRRAWEYYRAPARRMHPIGAVRVVAAGQACAYAGSLIAGWHAGVLIDLAPVAGMAAPNASSSLMMIIGGLMWVIIGFIVEQLCRLPPDPSGEQGDEDEDNVEGYAV